MEYRFLVKVEKQTKLEEQFKYFETSKSSRNKAHKAMDERTCVV